MPRYFFHLHNDIDSPDEEGKEIAEDHDALQTALEYARRMASEAVRQGSLDLRHFIVCIRDDGREVGIVRFGDAVKVMP
jgi:hypothetical protein